MKKHKSKLGLLLCLFVILFSAVMPFQVFAKNDFYSSNDILFYDSNATDNNCIGGSYGTAPDTADLKSFVDQYGQGAYNIGSKYGIPYEAILAQGILESNYGKSELAYKYYNFFGMKAGSSWTGGIINYQTKEQDSTGKETTINADFRTYPSVEVGWEGYALFITNNGNPNRYKDALNYYNDYISYIQAIKDAGYATDIKYVEKVVSVANSVANYIATNNKWPPSSELQKPVSLSISNISYNNNCSGILATNIVNTALSFALDTPVANGSNQESDAKQAYVDAIKTYNTGANVADCGIFVGTVMIASGVDVNYPKSGTSIQLNYVKQTTSKYLVIENPQRQDLQPGDILIVNNSENDHHTLIYTGNSPYPVVDASQDVRVPSVRNESSLTSMLSSPDVIIARVIQ